VTRKTKPVQINRL